MYRLSKSCRFVLRRYRIELGYRLAKSYHMAFRFIGTYVCRLPKSCVSIWFLVYRDMYRLSKSFDISIIRMENILEMLELSLRTSYSARDDSCLITVREPEIIRLKACAFLIGQLFQRSILIGGTEKIIPCPQQWLLIGLNIPGMF